MKKILFAIMTLTLVGCSSNENVEKEPVVKEVEVQEISKQNIETKEHKKQTEEPIKANEENIELFWEKYDGVEIIEAVNGGEKVYNFNVEAPLFEDALIESLTNKEEKDWTPYLASFTVNLGDQPPEGYLKKMNGGYLSILNGEPDLAIEQFKEAKKIREESE